MALISIAQSVNYPWESVVGKRMELLTQSGGIGFRECGPNLA